MGQALSQWLRGRTFLSPIAREIFDIERTREWAASLARQCAMRLQEQRMVLYGWDNPGTRRPTEEEWLELHDNLQLCSEELRILQVGLATARPTVHLTFDTRALMETP